MSNAWVTRADVLNDLREVNGRNAGVNHLDQYVVEGDRAPPNRVESPDEDEMQYHFGPGCTMPGANNAPDLRGIARMLQMVDDLEDSPDSDEPKTLFRNTATDEISISKLNPNVVEFVPNGGSKSRPQTKPKPLEKGRSPRKFDAKKPMFFRKSDKNPLSVSNNLDKKETAIENTEAGSKLNDTMIKNSKSPEFILESEKIQKNISNFDAKESKINLNKVNNIPTDTECINNLESPTAEATKHLVNGWAKRKIEKDNPNVNSCVFQMDQTNISNPTNSNSEISESVSLTKSLDVSKMKPDEIENMKKEIKAKIIVSSKDNCILKKRDRNVAMATLLKLCTIPTPNVAVEKPVKLITPQYFEANGDAAVSKEKESAFKNMSEPVEEDSVTVEPTVKTETNVFQPAKPEIIPLATTSTSAKSVEKERKYVDPIVEESISKVNDWFKNTGSPQRKKPEEEVQKPPVDDTLKNALAFKKKCTSSLSVVSPTPKSETSSGKKKTCAAFVPSDYANDLLLKYEKNAKSKVAPKEDLGTMLERELKERDQQIKKKLLEKESAMSPVSGRSDQ